MDENVHGYISSRKLEPSKMYSVVCDSRTGPTPFLTPSDSRNAFWLYK